MKAWIKGPCFVVSFLVSEYTFNQFKSLNLASKGNKSHVCDHESFTERSSVVDKAMVNDNLYDPDK
ncbi:hypothetical protein PRK78_005525 [Emydomyces testavorans]|uniref:Uncharacterized protein n=1 Tax=Emydomyces testavorans TaxID=2070801 RepID=A0AAF0IKT4_9EURO|nr:hypothetical protein PRK78_005525 [Emydomyces testavorans]